MGFEAGLAVVGAGVVVAGFFTSVGFAAKSGFSNSFFSTVGGVAVEVGAGALKSEIAKEAIQMLITIVTQRAYASTIAFPQPLQNLDFFCDLPQPPHLTSSAAGSALPPWAVGGAVFDSVPVFSVALVVGAAFLSCIGSAFESRRFFAADRRLVAFSISVWPVLSCSFFSASFWRHCGTELFWANGYTSQQRRRIN